MSALALLRAFEGRVRWRWQLDATLAWQVVPVALSRDGATLACPGGRVATSFAPSGLYATQALAEAAGAPPLPTAIPNLSQWLAAVPGTVALSGSLVDAWNDQSGNGRHVTAAGGDRPSYVANDTALGVPTLDFEPTGGDKFLTGPNFSDLLTADAGTIFLMMRSPADGARPVLSEQAIKIRIMVTAGLATIAQNDDGTLDSASVGGYVQNTWALLQWRHAAGTLFHQRNTIAEASVASGSTAALGPEIVGRGGFPFRGRVAEIMIWSRALSGSEISAVQAYATARFGVPS